MTLQQRHSPEPSSAATRALHVLLVAAIVLALIGLVVGMRQGKTVPEVARPEPPQVVADPAAIPAVAYDQFDRREHGPNRDWHNSLVALRQAPVDLFADVELSDEQRQLALRRRSERRAFDGAPPVVPHAIDQMSAVSCVACHESGTYVGRGVWAPRMSHPFMANCTQCHVEAHSPGLDPPPAADNHFQGLDSYGPGHRAWEGAPPTVPHPVFMREDCNSCHGPGAANAIHTSHPWRVSCLQCHAPSAMLDQLVPRFPVPHVDQEPGDAVGP